jgi:PKD repeat protein
MLRYITGMAIAVGCCLLSSTCGTYRAIIDDYEPDYIIRDIKPLSGVSGQQVTFDAAICETAGSRPIDDTTNPPQWIWNFGGGADPNVSYDAQPTVMLRDGIRAPYEGTLTVRGGCVEGQEVKATFTLDVDGLTVLTVAPTTGSAGSNATFSAIVGSGKVTDYLWDFGTAANPASSTAASPSVTLGTTGAYDCRLVISNDYEAFEYPFTLVIN